MIRTAPLLDATPTACPKCKTMMFEDVNLTCGHRQIGPKMRRFYCVNCGRDRFIRPGEGVAR